MTISRPGATLVADSAGSGPAAVAAAVLGGSALDLREAGVARLVVDLGVGTGHDRADVVVSNLSPLADTAPGETLTIAMAASGEPSDVLTTTVMRADDHPAGRHFVALAPSHRLGNLHLSRSYVQQSVADIVEDLLAEAEVDADVIDGSRTLAQYHVDARRSVWGNLHVLARLFGAEITTGADGALSFKPAPGASSGGLGGALAGAAGAVAGALGLGGGDGLRRGANVLHWELGPRRDTPRDVFGVAPLGAASPFGTPKGHHLLKAPDGAGGPMMVAAALRDTDSADGAATALTAGAQRRVTGGRVVVLGDPGLRAGADVTIDDDTWHMTSVRHRIDPVGGYLCELVVEGTA